MRKVFAAALALAVASTSGLALAEGDAANGEKVYRKCKACHAVGEGAENKVGPQLNGIVGAPAGSVEGFKYSDAFEAKKAEGMTWTVENLDAYLAKPKEFIEGTKMSFNGLRKESDRQDVIAYLETFQ